MSLKDVGEILPLLMDFQLLLDPVIQGLAFLLFEIVLIRGNEHHRLLFHLSCTKSTLSILSSLIMFMLCSAFLIALSNAVLNIGGQVA